MSTRKESMKSNSEGLSVRTASNCLNYCALGSPPDRFPSPFALWHCISRKKGALSDPAVS